MEDSGSHMVDIHHDGEEVEVHVPLEDDRPWSWSCCCVAAAVEVQVTRDNSLDYYYCQPMMMMMVQLLSPRNEVDGNSNEVEDDYCGWNITPHSRLGSCHYF